MPDHYTQRKHSLRGHSSWIQLHNTQAIIKSKVQYISSMSSQTLKITITTAINSTEDMNLKMQCFTFFGLRTSPNHFKTTNNDDQNITADWIIIKTDVLSNICYYTTVTCKHSLYFTAQFV